LAHAEKPYSYCGSRVWALRLPAMQEPAANKASAVSRQQADFHGNNVYGSCRGTHTSVAADLYGLPNEQGANVNLGAADCHDSKDHAKVGTVACAGARYIYPL